MSLVFPPSPVDGESFVSNGQTWIWDATIGKWQKAQNTFFGPANTNTQLVILDSGSGTYTLPANVNSIKVTCVGAGGGGGGVDGQGADASAAAAGGGAGAWCVKTIVNPAASYTYTIGAAGAGGAAGNNSGAAGGDTTFTDGGSVNMVATGGGGGGGDQASTGNGTGNPSNPVNATGGDVNYPGAGGFDGRSVAGDATSLGSGGEGPFGAVDRETASSGKNGNSATGYGAGGGGANCVGTTSNFSGGNGSGGLIVIEEYYAFTASNDVSDRLATKAEMEAGTNAVNLVTPLRASQGVGNVKAWAAYDQVTNTIDGNLNISSFTDNSGGQYSYTFTNVMSDANWAGPITSGRNDAAAARVSSPEGVNKTKATDGWGGRSQDTADNLTDDDHQISCHGDLA